MANLGIFYPGQPLTPVPASSGESNLRSRTNNGNGNEGGLSFAGALDAARKQARQVSFSRHAVERLESRQLDLSEQDLARLDDTVEKMAQKGAKESLIYMNDIALVVSVANRKVITAMDGMSARENIFTNIDSAAII